MGIPVKLEVFEGPLDLLLHLIDKNKIDIYDIPISFLSAPASGLPPAHHPFPWAASAAASVT